MQARKRLEEELQAAMQAAQALSAGHQAALARAAAEHEAMFRKQAEQRATQVGDLHAALAAMHCRLTVVCTLRLA